MEGLIKFRGNDYAVLVKKDTVTHEERTFTESTTFVVPPGVTSITVEVAGAGGGSNGHYAWSSSSGGDCCDCGEA